MNSEAVSRRFEIGAPPLHRKVRAARRAQEAGYLVRVRIDPIVPTADWKEAYAETVERFLAEV